MATAEVMTACENVCRDFSWLVALADWGPTLLTCLVALFIAFFAYPWQKKRDRKLQIELEQRAIYRDMVASIDDVSRNISKLSANSADAMGEDIQALSAAMQNLDRFILQAALLADVDIVNSAAECGHKTGNLLELIKADIIKLRDDENGSISAPDLCEALERRKRDVLVELDREFNALLNIIRKKAFDLPGEVQLRSRYLDDT